MAIWQWALLGFALLWGFQSLGVWHQMRHYTDVMKGISTKYNDGFVGAGHVRGRFGRGAIVLLVVDRELKVRRYLQMSGRTVFAKFKRHEEFEGLHISEVEHSDTLSDPKSEISRATKQAIAHIETIRKDGDGNAHGLAGIKAVGV